MEENKVTEVVDVTDVQVVEKESFGTKIKNGAKKVFSSKPAKIIGGVLLAAGGAVVGYSYAKRDDATVDDEYFYDEEDEFTPEEDIPDEQVND